MVVSFLIAVLFIQNPVNQLIAALFDPDIFRNSAVIMLGGVASTSIAFFAIRAMMWCFAEPVASTNQVVYSLPEAALPRGKASSLSTIAHEWRIEDLQAAANELFLLFISEFNKLFLK
jgi:hypothetical protein